MTSCGTTPRSDLVGNTRKFLLHWGLPAGAMLAALFVPNFVLSVIWVLALTWMGVACLVNARGCGRTHCYFTGPFFLLMIVPVLLLGFEVIWLGPLGWAWLGLAIFLGAGALWFISEYVRGKYIQTSEMEKTK